MQLVPSGRLVVVLRTLLAAALVAGQHHGQHASGGGGHQLGPYGGHYNVLHDGDNAFQRAPRGGPNVCRSRSSNYCCPGWVQKPSTGLCMIPICRRVCGQGRCVKPNICLCDDGTVSPTCTDGNNGSPPPDGRHPDSKPGTCQVNCLNGGTCSGNQCICRPGFQGQFCGEPVCQEPCLNGGRCIGPDRCACVYGFTGRHCEADYRTGPCFTKVTSDSCQGQLTGVVCTKQLCCATIGLAWGHPCEQCPSRLDCEPGYLKNIHSGRCMDIDECEAIPSLCEGGRCVNTDGSFRCECPEGQTRAPDGSGCQDLDECLDPSTCRNGHCVNTNGGYYCICSQGFIPTPDQKWCIDSRQGNCYTTISKTGQCRNRMRVRLTKRDCCCMHNMGKGWGEEVCEPCPFIGQKEYEQLCLEPGQVTKMDECALMPNICKNGRCVDTPESYRCECHPGYEQRLPSSPCEDVNECSQRFCQGGKCINTIGSFICTCPAGFDVSSDGRFCIDHDECSETGMCANGQCINMDGSFKCRCHDGYVLSSTGHSCIDFDECLENPRICLYGRCENVPGSYRCVCQEGFTPSTDGTFCLDRDECAESGMCSHGRCVNMDGSFKCVCEPGFRISANGKQCVDVDECVNNPCRGGRCINSQGSFKCECLPGLSLGPDGRSCVDTRRDFCYAHYRDGQCLTPSTTPVTKSSCCCCTIVINQPLGWGTPCRPCPQPGSDEFESLCPHGPGMTHNGDDINECAQNPNICQNGACENLLGTYRCVCNPGYQVDASGKICTDVNECAVDNLLCDGGQCRNTPGSYQCICPTGTQLNPASHVCQDVDECRDGGGDNCINGVCINTVGSYSCECSDGSMIDSTGRICIDNRQGSCWTKIVDGRCEFNLARTMLKSECCCSVGLGWGSPCEICSSKDCDCPGGFAKLDGKTCVDINECDLYPGICKGGGRCVNTEGSFTCQCPPGLTLDASKTSCLDLREEPCFLDYRHGVCGRQLEGFCFKSLCCCTVGRAWGHACELCPRPGTQAYEELCPKGFGFSGRKDVNECTAFPGMCSNGRCKNSIGSYSCRCNQGYALDEDGVRCIDIDECGIMRGVCGNGECQNIAGSFMCECEEGFESTAMMQVCMDIDECSRTPGLCRGGNCINTPGSFRCECPPGHELTPEGNACKDTDECSRTSGICSHGICENMMGTYQCVCNDGFQQTGLKSHCEDIDECGLNNGGCDGICVNTLGTFTCTCGAGYMLLVDGRSCVDVDECTETTRACNGGRCSNTAGGYRCECTDGLVPGSDSTTCLDLDECRVNPNICLLGQCENTLGSYTCRCEEGYSLKPGAGPGCTDDDECNLGTFMCHPSSDCHNTHGSYDCKCQVGFTGDGRDCRDVNECLVNNGGCHQDAQCINGEGSFRCVCDPGFHGDGFSCQDLDECSDNPALCENGQCLNYPGSFRCECEMGFMHPDERNEQACIDIDECDMFNNLCVFGRCENIFGMFRCICNKGYQLDNSGGNCTDTDECETPQSCQFGTCINTQGGYICQCPPNYELVEAGNACVDRRQGNCFLEARPIGRGRGLCNRPLGEPVSRSTCCCSIGKAWGPYCELCPSTDSAEYETLCPRGIGFRPNSITLLLEDIDECEEMPDLCKNGRCSNTFGSFMCTCHDGYRLDDRNAMCRDWNECEQDPNVCSVGTCINDEGGYHCLCPDGYMLLPSGKDCVDMRRELCFMSHNNETGACSDPMSNRQTHMLCCCSMGAAWGHPCRPCPKTGTQEYLVLCGSHPGQVINPMTGRPEEIDECALMPQMCRNGVCVNTPLSFFCECHRGYVYDEGSHQCIDDNECNRIPSPCLGNAQCVNTPGSFECRCPEGYKLGITMRDCVDIDECRERPGICNNGECNNFQGSFQCVCQPGYVPTPGRDSCVDVDECQRNPSICNNGSCLNGNGMYKCHCHPGFKLSHNNDCIDIDECRTLLDVCRNGRCRNVLGSFTCECADGYRLTDDGRNCRDINECVEVPGTCPPPGTCQNLMGSFTCTCPPGYKLEERGTRCQDIDECRTIPGICSDGRCTNTAGGFLCECPDGYVLSGDGKKCVDMREDQCYESFFRGQCGRPRPGQQVTLVACCCTMGAAWGRHCQRCPREGTADFKKMCPDGPGRGPEGRDLNECELSPDACDGGECINTDGSYRCECPMGFVLDGSGKKCIDDNECVLNNICGNGTCTNVEGGFECQCADGFAPGPMQVCEDVDECREMGNQCAFRCHNVPGSFRCVCPYGYALAPDGRHCLDVDECATPANNCKFACKNLIGAFMCVCPDGYRQVGGGDECVDVNECQQQRDLCRSGHCINTRGGYRCECFDGYQPSHDHKQCVDHRQGLCFRHLVGGTCTQHTEGLMQTSKADCCCTMGAAWGPRCDICPPKDSREYNELCLEAGFSMDGHDIDECHTVPDLCRNGHCINTLGSYRCMCNKGYKPDRAGTRCFDVNECEQTPSPCRHACQNTDGSYTCSCPHGYILNPDGISCRDMDECSSGRHACQHECVNTQGSYTCTCPKGYHQVGDQCVDLNECLEQTGVCPPPGTCINTLGSFKCVCPRGFELDQTGSMCVDADECEGDPSKCQFGCQNVVGSFRCGCPDGYVQHFYYHQCMDDNECSQSACGSASCYNTIGSFKCTCPDGYQFEPALLVCVQVGSGCTGAPCSFGCTSLSGGSGFACGCPSGYQTIGQGHCLATINPPSYTGHPGYGDDIGGGIPTYPVHSSDYYGAGQSTDSIISTEGCFSCKVGQNKRTRRQVEDLLSGVREKVRRIREVHWNTTVGDVGWVVDKRREARLGGDEQVVLKVRLAQTRHRERVVRLQPALNTMQGKVEYVIRKGNEGGQFEMTHRKGVWALHFKRRLKKPGTFDLEIRAKGTGAKEEPLSLRVRIVVTN